MNDSNRGFSFTIFLNNESPTYQTQKEYTSPRKDNTQTGLFTRVINKQRNVNAELSKTARRKIPSNKILYDLCILNKWIYKKRKNSMGMNAYVAGFGPFKKDLIKYLDYDESSYTNVSDGTKIYVTCFHCPTNSTSRDLAGALGINDPYDFNHSRILIEKVDFSKLIEIQLQSIIWDDDLEIEGFKKFMENGFVMMYTPN